PTALSLPVELRPRFSRRPPGADARAGAGLAPSTAPFPPRRAHWWSEWRGEPAAASRRRRRADERRRTFNRSQGDFRAARARWSDGRAAGGLRASRVATADDARRGPALRARRTPAGRSRTGHG